jgi:hypothetical protein
MNNKNIKYTLILIANPFFIPHTTTTMEMGLLTIKNNGSEDITETTVTIYRNCDHPQLFKECLKSHDQYTIPIKTITFPFCYIPKNCEGLLKCKMYTKSSVVTFMRMITSCSSITVNTPIQTEGLAKINEPFNRALLIKLDKEYYCKKENLSDLYEHLTPEGRRYVSKCYLKHIVKPATNKLLRY